MWSSGGPGTFGKDVKTMVATEPDPIPPRGPRSPDRDHRAEHGLHPVMDGSGVQLPTVADVLQLPEVRRGHPSIEAAAHALGRPVRWVHVSEIADIGHLLQGGELILSTGVALPEAADGLTRYIAGLAAAQATGVVIELGRRYASLPAALVQSAEAHGLPLVALHTEVPFVAITEAIHSVIVSTQVRRLQMGEAVHQAFRSLAAEASTSQEIVDQVARLAGCPVVFENVARRVLAFAGVTDGPAVLDHWVERSREAAWTDRSGPGDDDRWMATTVGARGQVWGRLVLLPNPPPGPLLKTILEQGATTLAIHLLIEREERFLEHQTHRTLIADIIDHRYAGPDEAHARAEALGVVTRHRDLTALVVRTERGVALADIARHAAAREEVTAVARALTDAGASGLVGLLEPGRLGVILSTPSTTRAHAVIEACARAVHDRAGRLAPSASVVIGVGSSVTGVDRLRESFAEADEAADAGQSLPGNRLFVTTADIRIRGLVHLLRDDPRLQSYAERELGPLIAHDQRHHTALTGTLVAYLEAGGNKSAAAVAAHVTRATLYHHLARIAEILGCDLESPESRHSLYLALVARQSVEHAGRAAGSGEGGNTRRGG